MKAIDIPAIRGVLGKITFYAATFTFKQIAERVKLVDHELHTSKSLREQLQRALTDNHKSIKEYILTQKEHFFNAIVLAVYDGDPTWNELEFEYKNRRYYSMGFLHLNGEEHIFPVDGQHRVEGIRSALKENPQLSEETITVIFIGHHDTKEGKEKTRRIFSTLNRYAKPVSLGDNIALDEDDIVAITTRDLLENYPLFMNENVKIDKKSSKALSDNDEKSFTSLITLYETNKIIYTYYRSNYDHQLRIYNAKKITEFLKYRPKQQDIENFYKFLVNFWNMFVDNFQGMKSYIENCDNDTPAIMYRNKESGGLLYFRPIALPRLVKAIFETQNRLKNELKECIIEFAGIEMNINKEPWENILWDNRTHTMIMKYKNIIYHMLIFLLKKELLTKNEIAVLAKNFAKANDLDDEAAKSRLFNLKSVLI